MNEYLKTMLILDIFLTGIIYLVFMLHACQTSLLDEYSSTKKNVFDNLL